MAKVLFVVSGATYWVLKDGTRYATGYWAEEFAAPYKALTEAGHEVVVATPHGVTPNVDMMSLRPSMAGGEQGALEVEEIIRSSEVMRRPLQLSDVRLEDYDAGVSARRSRPHVGPVAGRRRGPARIEAGPWQTIARGLPEASCAVRRWGRGGGPRRHRRERLRRVAEDITRRDGRARVVEADVTVPEQAYQALQETREEHVRLDSPVDNAGVMSLDLTEGARPAARRAPTPTTP
jgi:hypothetical protein